MTYRSGAVNLSERVTRPGSKRPSGDWVGRPSHLVWGTLRQVLKPHPFGVGQTPRHQWSRDGRVEPALAEMENPTDPENPDIDRRQVKEVDIPDHQVDGQRGTKARH